MNFFFSRFKTRTLFGFVFFTHILLAQDKMYLNDGSVYGINLRTSDIKKGLFIVPKTINGNQVFYNYTRLDIDKIITTDSNLVKVILKYDSELGRLFAFTNSQNKTIFYADHWYTLNVLKSEKKNELEEKKKYKIAVKDSTQKAQNKLDFKFAFRLTNTMSIFSLNNAQTSENQGSNSLTQTITKKHYVTFFSPSFGFSYLNKRKSLHDIELGIISANSDFNQTQVTNSQTTYTTSGVDKTKVGVSLMYRFSFFFFKNSKSKFLPSLGLSTGAFFEYSTLKPLVKSSFPQSTFLISVPFYIEPALNYFVTSNCFLFVSVPIKVNQLNYKSIFLDNSVVPTHLRTTTAFSGDSFFKTDTWMLRFGLVVKLK